MIIVLLHFNSRIDSSFNYKLGPHLDVYCVDYVTSLIILLTFFLVITTFTTPSPLTAPSPVIYTSITSIIISWPAKGIFSSIFLRWDHVTFSARSNVSTTFKSFKSHRHKFWCQFEFWLLLTFLGCWFRDKSWLAKRRTPGKKNSLLSLHRLRPLHPLCFLYPLLSWYYW